VRCWQGHRLVSLNIVLLIVIIVAVIIYMLPYVSRLLLLLLIAAPLIAAVTPIIVLVVLSMPTIIKAPLSINICLNSDTHHRFSRPKEFLRHGRTHSAINIGPCIRHCCFSFSVFRP